MLRHSAITTCCLLLAGCSFGAAANRPSTPSASPATSSSPTPSATGPASCAERVFATLTFPQRVGQLFVIGLANDQLGPAERQGIKTYHFGSVSFIVKTSAGVSGVRAVANSVQAQATKATTGGVRFYVAANQEGGEIQSLQGAGFSGIPSAVAQGMMSTSTLEREAALWGRQLVEAGVNFNFAPVMDVVPPGTDSQNQPIGVLHGEYGHDPQTVALHGLAFMQGMRQAGLATSVKHFPGLGRVRGNTDFTAGVDDQVTTRNDPYLYPFAQAIDAGVPFVMVALARYTRIDSARLAVFSPVVMRRMLRQELHFTGVIISDDLGASKAVGSIPTGQRAIDFLSAGGDMVISKFVGPAELMAQAVLSRAAMDGSFRKRVDAAVLRILTAKQASGRLPCAA